MTQSNPVTKHPEKLIALNRFGFMTILGRDAEKFLQGYTTCDLAALDDQHLTPGAVCNIQGRMLANFLAIRYETGFLLRLDRGLIEPVMAFLKKYIVFSKAEMSDKSDSLYCYGLSAVDTEFPQEDKGFTVLENGFLINLGEDRKELWSMSELNATGSLSSWTEKDIDAGVVWLDSQTTEEYIPQMLNLHQLGGISFSKGCYLGQEIVARMQYRGELKKKLHLCTSSALPKRGLTLPLSISTTDGKVIGELVSAEGTKGLAVIQNKGDVDLTHLMLSDGSLISAVPLS